MHSYLTFHRGAGVICVVAGAALGFLAGQTRKGDARFRRADHRARVSVTVVLVGLVAVFAGIHMLSLVGLLPIIVGALLLTRPRVPREWFTGAGIDDRVAEDESPSEVERERAVLRARRQLVLAAGGSRRRRWR